MGSPWFLVLDCTKQIYFDVGTATVWNLNLQVTKQYSEGQQQIILIKTDPFVSVLFLHWDSHPQRSFKRPF